MDGTAPEVDVTSRFVFWVPDNYLIGDFPLDGGPLFTTRLPVLATDPPQQGGTLTVEAEALNPGNVPVTATTSLTVQLVAQLTYPEAEDGGVEDAGLPPNPGSLFAAERVGRAIRRARRCSSTRTTGRCSRRTCNVLDVHWMPGSANNTVFQITFQSAAASITYYTGCGTLGGLMIAGSCGFELDATGYAYLSQSNAGAGNVALTIKGTDSTGTAVGTSQTFNIQFAEQAGQRRRLLLGRHRHADHALRLRRRRGRRPSVFLSPGRVRHERHVHRVPRALARRDQDGGLGGRAGQRPARVRQRHRR